MPAPSSVPPGEDWSHVDGILKKEWVNTPRLVSNKRPDDKPKLKPLLK